MTDQQGGVRKLNVPVSGASMQLSVEQRHHLRDWNQTEREESFNCSPHTIDTVGCRFSPRSPSWIRTDRRSMAFKKHRIVLLHEHRSLERTDEPIRTQVACKQRSR
ncbi:hypothetical protein PUN28_007107 [Cardiocondyla obscurior]|uniref:Uncharacterized protein n=1 Tax=Cardiocondyla obscurior TaxID=286306 RepID=A0AAW2G4D6_9HYME